MALSDYSTAVEKIAALKAAMIDPALMNIATSNFTTSDIIYPVTPIFSTVGLTGKQRYDINLNIPYTIKSGESITFNETYETFLYIKNSDIIYTDPIDTYQDRLVTMFTSDRKQIHGVATPSGLYGSLITGITAYSSTDNLEINGRKAFNAPQLDQPVLICIPNGVTFNHSYTYAITYFDLPADW